MKEFITLVRGFMTTKAQQIKEARKQAIEEEKMISTKEFAEILGVTMEKLHSLMKSNSEKKFGFPVPYQLAARVFRWKKREVLAYKKNRLDAGIEGSLAKDFISRKEVAKRLEISVWYFNKHFKEHPACPKPFFVKDREYYKPEEVEKFLEALLKEKREQLKMGKENHVTELMNPSLSKNKELKQEIIKTSSSKMTRFIAGLL